MSNVALVRKLRKIVSRHGAAQVAVWLKYKDTRSIGVWLAKEKIPAARIELVKALVQEKGA